MVRGTTPRFRATQTTWRPPSSPAGYRRCLHWGEHRTALMCAEAPWWRCHRRLISDLLTHRGHEVLHIVSHAEPKPHPLNPMAQAVGPALVYPPAQTELF